MSKDETARKACHAVVSLAAVLAVAAAVLALPARVAQAATTVAAGSGRGTIVIEQTDDDTKEPVAGGTVAIYQVGVLGEDAYAYVAPFDSLAGRYDLTEKIRESQGTYSGETDSKYKTDTEYLARLAEVAESEGTPVVEPQEVGADGVLSVSGLDEGAYLVVETEPAPGYNTFNTFLVTVPLEGADEDGYKVDASPKLDPVTTTGSAGSNGNSNTTTSNGSSGGSSSSSTTSSTTSTASDTLTDARLPQTGQLWWPVWALIGAGVVLVAAGIVRKRKQGHES